MVDQLGRTLLTSPLAPNFGTGTAAVSSRCLVPCNVRSDGATRLSSAGAFVPTLSSVRRRGPLAMVLCAAILLVDVRRNLSEILVKNC